MIKLEKDIIKIQEKIKSLHDELKTLYSRRYLKCKNCNRKTMLKHLTLTETYHYSDAKYEEGMYEYSSYEYSCPKCGKIVANWQFDKEFLKQNKGNFGEWRVIK